MDLRDLEHNTRDGIHIASLAGAWTAAVAGFGGMRDYAGRLSFAPRLPSRLERLTFRMRYRGRRLKIAVARDAAAYTLIEGPPLDVLHHGRTITLQTGATATEPIPHVEPVQPTPSQPYGRAPLRRSSESD